MLNHWSNGNSYCSRGPPQSDAALTISYVKAYFNSSTLSNLYAATCSTAEQICQAPDQTKPPDPSGAEGRWEGKIFSFSGDKCGEQASLAVLAAPNRTTTASGTSTGISIPPGPAGSKPTGYTSGAWRRIPLCNIAGAWQKAFCGIG